MFASNPGRDLLRRLDPNVPIIEIAPASDRVTQSSARLRFTTLLMGALGVIALSVALIGIYGAFSWAVRERTREIGIRVAVGAAPRDILTEVLSKGARLTLAGLAIGWGLALLMTPVVASFLFEISPMDPATYAAIGLGLVGSALAASYSPAQRASRGNPVDALRQG